MTCTPIEDVDLDALPKEISRETVLMAGIELTVINLDNGQRVIAAEDMEKLFGPITPPTEIDK